MVTPEMLDYIKQQRAQGRSDADIHTSLTASGWPEANINAGFAQLSGQPVPVGAPLPQIPSAMELLKQAWTIYKQRWGTLVIISLLPVLAIVGMGFVLGGGGFLASRLELNIIASGILGLLAALLAIIFFIYLCIWGAVAALVAVRDHQEQIGWQEAFKRARSKINDFFTTQALAGLTAVGGIIAIILTYAILNVIARMTSGVSWITVINFVLGILFIPAIVACIIFGLWFSQSGYVVVCEGLKNTAALKRSKHYVTGRIGTVFAKMFFIGFVMVLFYIIITIIAGALGGFSSLAGGHNNNFSILNNILSIFIGPLVTCYYFLLYKALAETRP